MLTLFTIPKAFEGQFQVIQRNAIESWTRVHPGCQILLLGDEPGTAATARRLGVQCVPEVPRSEFGTPLVSGLFAAAEQHAIHPVLCYINADIMLLPDFPEAVRRVLKSGRPSLMVGRRWDVEIHSPVEFSAGWDLRLRRQVSKLGRRQGAGAIDYFVYPKGALGPIPPFAIGRTAYDNWLLYHAEQRGLRLVDATSCVMAIHQNHDYSHDRGGAKNVWEGPEAQRNRALSGGSRYWYNLYNARRLLTRWGMLPAWTFRHLKRRWKTSLLQGGTVQ